MKINSLNLKNSDIVSRLAPTPSGYLHAGNAINFIITAVITRAFGGVLHLRIDDYDSSRYRKEYVQNIFDVLSWLGIEYDFGARSVAEFESYYSCKCRIQDYENALYALVKKGLVYECDCGKKTYGAYDLNSRYLGLCRQKIINLDSILKVKNSKKALRISLKDTDLGLNEMVFKKHSLVELGKNFSVIDWAWDFVLLKKDTMVSYNLASLIDDVNLGVNLLIRGLDLRHCSYQQSYVSRVLGLGFEKALFIYHELILKGGKKLSKSSLAPALNLHSLPNSLYIAAGEILGLNANECSSIEQMINSFKQKHIHNSK